MPEFDPIKIFKRMWAMRGWERVITVVTIVATGIAIVSLFTGKIPTLWAVIGAVFMWVILIISYLITTSHLKKDLNELISKGEWIKARLTDDTEASIDKHEKWLREWDTAIDKILKGTEYENFWKSNAGLVKPNDESVGGTQGFLNVQKNYVHLRLLRLLEIKSSLSD